MKILLLKEKKEFSESISKINAWYYSLLRAGYICRKCDATENLVPNSTGFDGICHKCSDEIKKKRNENSTP